MGEIVKLVFPIFVIILLGYFAARKNFLDKNAGSLLSRYLFYFSLPFLTFANIYNTGLENLLNLDFILGAVITIFLVIVISSFFHKKVFGLSGPELIMAVFGGFYVNATYMGMPVSTLLLGSVTPPLIILVIQAGMIFPLIIYLLDRKTSGKTKFSLTDSLIILAKNPLMIAAAGAVLSLALKIKYPEFIMMALDLLGKPASTAGLFALGFTCYLPADSSFTKREQLQALSVSLFKLLLQPLLAYLIGRYVVRLDDWWLRALVVVAMLPTAVNHFIASQKYKLFQNESKLLILFTTFGFTITVSFFLLLI